MIVADLLDTSDGHDSARKRARHPELAGCLDDFYLSLCHPGAFQFEQMPQGWQRAQRTLAGEYQRLQTMLKVETLKRLARLQP